MSWFVHWYDKTCLLDEFWWTFSLYLRHYLFNVIEYMVFHTFDTPFFFLDTLYVGKHFRIVAVLRIHKLPQKPNRIWWATLYNRANQQSIDPTESEFLWISSWDKWKNRLLFPPNVEHFPLIIIILHCFLCLLQFVEINANCVL